MNTIFWFLVVMLVGINGPERHALSFISKEKCQSFQTWTIKQRDIWTIQGCRKMEKDTRDHTVA